MKKAKTHDQAHLLEQIPNVGPAVAADMRGIGIDEPRQLIGRDPYELYELSSARAGVRQDPCVCDTYIAAVRFMEGAPPHPWWHYTAERKRRFATGHPRA